MIHPNFIGSSRGEHAPHALDLQPLTQIHLDPGVRWGLEPASNSMHSRVLTAISLFVLLTACINFTNLSIGLSAGRTREIGPGVETFALGAFLTLLMVLAAVEVQALRAALANPVDALHYE